MAEKIVVTDKRHVWMYFLRVRIADCHGLYWGIGIDGRLEKPWVKRQHTLSTC